MSRAQDAELVRRARGQHGLLGRADATDVLQRDDAFEVLLAGRLWQEALPGVLVPAARVVTVDDRERGVHLWEPGALLSHYSAARWDGFWVPDDSQAWALVPYDSPKRDLPGLQVRRTRRWPQWCWSTGGVRYTQAPRTIVDLSALLTPRQLQAVLMSALRLGKTTVADVATEAARLRKRPGVAGLLALTGLWDPKRESLLEDRLFGDVTAVCPYPVERQWTVTDAEGRIARLDVAVPALRLAFEADGLFFHSTEDQIQADQERDRWLAAAGWPTHRFREGPLDDRLAVRRQVRALLERRASDLGLAA